jgi:hypothetical protein
MAYVVWRAILTSTMIAGFGLDLALDIIDGVAAWFPIYLSNWALFFQNCYLFSASAIALWIYMKQPDPASEQPFSTKIAWFLRSTGQSGALIVSVSYWALVHNGQITLRTLWIHAINSIIVCIDVLTSCYEVRLMHYVYVLALGGVYIVWTVVHHYANIRDGRSPSNRYIYSAIDWSEGSEGKVRKKCTTHISSDRTWIQKNVFVVVAAVELLPKIAGVVVAAVELVCEQCPAADADKGPSRRPPYPGAPLSHAAVGLARFNARKTGLACLLPCGDTERSWRAGRRC